MRSGPSIRMNHCGVARVISGALERQECGYECVSVPRCNSPPAAASAAQTGSAAL